MRTKLLNIKEKTRKGTLKMKSTKAKSVYFIRNDNGEMYTCVSVHNIYKPMVQEDR